MSSILSTIGSALGYDAPSKQDEISIQVGNTKIVGWETVSITRSVEGFPNSFTLTAADQYPDDATRATVFPTGPGEKCQVFAGSDLLITGYVDSYGINIGGGRHDVTITGRGLCQDLTDCSADLEAAGAVGGTLSRENAIDLARILCEPYKITARSAVAELGRPVKFFTVALGQTPYEIIERVARYAAYLVYEDQNGALVLDRVGTQSMASGFTMPGNIESASSTLSIHQRYSHYTVVWNTIAQYNQISPVGNNRADLDDPAFIKLYPDRKRLLIIQSEQIDPDTDYGKARANWELARRIGRSQAIALTCDSWRDVRDNKPGALWQPNMLVPIDAPALKINNAKWIIGTVTFRKDASGTHADLVLMPADAFTPEPTPLNLYNRQIMDAIAHSGAATPPIAPTTNAP